MTRLRCLDCQDGRHCRQRGYVLAGMILASCRCLDCDPQPIQARLFSHALVENDLGGCVDCGQPATKLLVGGAGQPDISLCVACEYRRYLQATAAATWPTRSGPAGASRPFPGPRSWLAVQQRRYEHTRRRISARTGTLSNMSSAASPPLLIVCRR
jgi:hypothetical protein